MRSSRLGRLTAIIGVALLLAACSTMRLAYNHAPQLAWWWLDDYLDFGSEQAPQVKEQLDRWHAWHRQSQLAEYADFLRGLQPQATLPMTPALLCERYEQARVRLRPAIERALQTAAEFVPQLQPRQIAALEKRIAKANTELRKKYLQPEREKRREATLDRWIENAERFYGRLGPAQRQLLLGAVDTSPFDPQRWLADRERRQRELLELLRRWQAEKPDRAQVTDGLRQLFEQTERSPDPAHRRYQQAMTAHQCRIGAELHNSMDAAQREALREQLASWERDLRALAAQAAP